MTQVGFLFAPNLCRPRLHPVRLDVIPHHIHDCEVEEASKNHVRLLVNLSLSGVDAELARHRTVDDAIRSPCVRREECAAELGTRHRFRHGDEQRHVFGFAARHDGVDGYVPSGDVRYAPGMTTTVSCQA